MRNYVSLHNHTTGSIGDSLILPKELIETTKQLNQSAVAITDHGSMSALWSAYKVAKKENIKLIAGCEYYFVNDSSNKDDNNFRHIVLLAKNAVGYKNLLTINKLGYDNFSIVFKKAIPRIDWNILKDHSEGIICTSACGNGIISQFIMNDQIQEAKNAAKALKDIFGDDFALELQPHNLQIRASSYSGNVNQQKINMSLKRISEELDIKCIVTTDAHYLKKEHHKAHDVYICDVSGQPINSGARLKYDKHEFYMKSSDDIYEHFSRHIKIWGESFVESLFENTIYFSDKCENPSFIDPAVVTGSKSQLPDFPYQDTKDYNDFLSWKNEQEQNPGPLWKSDIPEDAKFYRYRSAIGLEEKIKEGKIKEEDRQYCYEQMLEEFDVLEFRGFSSYMLITADFLEWCRDNNIPVGPGRGCTTKDTLVLTKNGYKNINELKGGDFVYTHTGEKHKVVTSFDNGLSDDLVKIKTIYGFDTQSFTKDHLLFGITKENNNNHWIPAKSIQKGDYLFHSWPIQNIKIPEKIDLSKYYKDNIILDDNIQIINNNKPTFISIKKMSKILSIPVKNITDYKNNKSEKYKDIIDNFLIQNNIQIQEWKTKQNITTIKRFIEWNKDFYYLLGRWVGDGCFHKNEYGITIAFNKKDSEGILKVTNLLNKFFGKICISECKLNSVNLTVCSISVYNLFKDIFPNYNHSSESKHFPSNFRYLPKNLLESLLKGYFDSDGNKTEYGFRIRTTSKQLALETKELLSYLKIPSGVNVEENPKRYDKITKTVYTISYSNNKKYVTDNGFYCRVVSIENDYKQNTYDIKVKKDASYLTTNFVAHNSVGGSLTAYLNNIHLAYPKKYGLIFARFLNKFKDAFPDIDNDISPDGRDLLQKYIENKYGHANVAHVSNINTITPKVYARDISRVFEFGGEGRSKAAEIGNNIADSIPDSSKSIKNAVEESPLFAEYTKQYPELLEFADLICGKPRAWSTHAAGIVISKNLLSDLVPLRRDVEGSLVLQHDKIFAEEEGLIKMDLLGLETLSIIGKTYNLIKESGKDISTNFDYEIEDVDSYKLISDGDTFGVFQLATTAVHVCKKIKPKNIDDIALINALVRPAAKDVIPELIKVRNGEEEMKLLHPALTRAFAGTYGFGLYEEALLYLALDISAWDLNEADKLRKLTKEKGKNPEKVKQWREEFIRDAVNNGFSEEIATKIWDETISGFGGYGFNKCLHYNQMVDIYDKNTNYLGSKEIKNIVPGEYVRSRDENTKEDIFVEVINNHSNGIKDLVEIELDTGEKIRCTMDHKFRVQENGDMLPLSEIIDKGLTIVVNKYE